MEGLRLAERRSDEDDRALAGEAGQGLDLLGRRRAGRLGRDRAGQIAGDLPHRERYLRLNHALARRIVQTHADWLDEVERELGSRGGDA